MSCDNDDCTVVSTDVTHSISDDGSFMVTANLSLNANEQYSICANVTYETGEYLITNKIEVSKYSKHVHVHVLIFSNTLGTHDIQNITITDTTDNELCDLVIGWIIEVAYVLHYPPTLMVLGLMKYMYIDVTLTYQLMHGLYMSVAVSVYQCVSVILLLLV